MKAEGEIDSEAEVEGDAGSGSCSGRGGKGGGGQPSTGMSGVGKCRRIGMCRPQAACGWYVEGMSRDNSRGAGVSGGKKVKRQDGGRRVGGHGHAMAKPSAGQDKVLAGCGDERRQEGPMKRSEGRRIRQVGWVGLGWAGWLKGRCTGGGWSK